MSPVHLSVRKAFTYNTSINTCHFPSSLLFSRDSLCQRKFFIGKNWLEVIMFFYFLFFTLGKDANVVMSFFFFCCSRFLSQTRQFLVAYVDALLLNLNIHTQGRCKKLITYNKCLLSTAQRVFTNLLEFMSITEKCLTSSIMLIGTLHGLFFSGKVWTFSLCCYFKITLISCSN